MRVLVACEESQEVCKAFRAKGHEAYSCDILPCSGGHPEWHIHGDVIEVMNDQWDLLIGHPPCTYLTVTGNRWFDVERYGESAKDRHFKRLDAARFFLQMWFTDAKMICIENPIGFMNGIVKPSQIIQPYFFGDEAMKTTCLWLRGLPKLKHNQYETLFERSTHVSKGEIITFESGKSMPKWYSEAFKLPKEERSKIRSKTFPGIAKAMANQWG